MLSRAFEMIVSASFRLAHPFMCKRSVLLNNYWCIFLEKKTEEILKNLAKLWPDFQRNSWIIIFFVFKIETNNTIINNFNIVLQNIVLRLLKEQEKLVMKLVIVHKKLFVSVVALFISSFWTRLHRCLLLKYGRSEQKQLRLAKCSKNWKLDNSVGQKMKKLIILNLCFTLHGFSNDATLKSLRWIMSCKICHMQNMSL